MKQMMGFILLFIFAAEAYGTCNIPVREKSYTKYHQGTYYDLLSLPKSTMANLSTSPQYNYLAHFKKRTQEKTDTSYKALLNKQKVFYKNVPGDAERYDKIITGKVGRVRTASCLESFLLDNHLRTFSSATEYSAFILTKPEEANAIVIFYTQTKDGTVAEPVITNLVEKYRLQGWNLESHLHNHPFSFDNPYGDIAGTIIPSPADVSSYKNMNESSKLRTAIITNGFDSFIMYRNEFAGF